MTRNQIMKIIKDENVQFFRLQFVDIFGFMKNVAIPKSQIEKALDGKMMFDGSSIDGFARINESDMYPEAGLRHLYGIALAEKRRQGSSPDYL